MKLAPTKAVSRVPPNFVENFVEGGWRRVERVYGTSRCVWQWVEMAGGADRLQSMRREYLKARTEMARQNLKKVTA